MVRDVCWLEVLVEQGCCFEEGSLLRVAQFVANETNGDCEGGHNSYVESSQHYAILDDKGTMATTIPFRNHVCIGYYISFIEKELSES